MQPASPPTGGAAPSTPVPEAPDVPERVADPRTAGEDARAIRGRALFRRYALIWVPVVLVGILIELVTIPDPAMRLSIVGLTAATGVAVLAAAFALSRSWTGRWPLVIVAAIDLAALAVALLSSSGNDTAIMLPFLGALLLVGVLDGPELRLALVIQWAVGMLGAAIAYGLGPLGQIPGADPLVVSLATSGAVTFVGYSLLWWVRDRLNAAAAAARLAEAEARSSAASMERLIRSTPIPTIGFDLEGTIRTWNTAAEVAFGWSLDEVRGSEAALLAPGAAAEDVPDAIVARVLAGEAIDGVRARWRNRDGREVLVELHAALLVEADGSPGGAVILAVDDTERERLRTRVTEVQRLEAVGQLAGGVAHDFNNLLTAVSGYAQLLADGLGEDDPARADAMEIERAAARGAELVRQLLMFGKRQVLSPRPLDVNALVDGLRPMLDRLIGTHAFVHVQPDPGVPPVLGDPGQLEQVIVNLVVNARDATPPGGDITIRTASVIGEDGVARTRLSVLDTGVGMDPATQARIFEPFFTTKAAGRGTGLGLATVYGIVGAHGGVITVASAIGKGTAFHVDLPSVPDASAPPAAPVARLTVASRAQSGTILVIDDEDAVRRLVVRALGAIGYRVLEAGDMWTAIQVAGGEQGAIDLLLSDIVMPDCRGPELVGRIRRFHPEARVLYMTGYAAEGLGGPEATDIDGPVLPKPFSVGDLAQRVSEAMEDRRPDA